MTLNIKSIPWAVFGETRHRSNTQLHHGSPGILTSSIEMDDAARLWCAMAGFDQEVPGETVIYLWVQIFALMIHP